MSRPDRYEELFLFDRPSTLVNQPIYERSDRSRQRFIDTPVGYLADIAVRSWNQECNDCRPILPLRPPTFEGHIFVCLRVGRDCGSERTIDGGLYRRRCAKAVGE